MNAFLIMAIIIMLAVLGNKRLGVQQVNLHAVEVFLFSPTGNLSLASQFASRSFRAGHRLSRFLC